MQISDFTYDISAGKGCMHCNESCINQINENHSNSSGFKRWFLNVSKLKLTTVATHQLDNSNAIFTTFRFNMSSINCSLSFFHRRIKSKRFINDLFQWFFVKKSMKKQNIEKKRFSCPIYPENTAMSLSMVLGIPTTETFKPRLRTSWLVEYRCCDDLNIVVKRRWNKIFQPRKWLMLLSEFHLLQLYKPWK